MSEAGLRRGPHPAGNDTQQAVGKVLEVVHPFLQKRVGDLAHAGAGALLDPLDRGFGGEAAVDRRIDPPRPALVVSEHAIGLEDLLMLARQPEFGVASHVVDLLAHLAKGRVDPVALGLDVLGDGVLDQDSRLVKHRLAARHSGDELETGQPQRSGAAQPAAAGAVDQPGAGDHFRQHHCDGLQRLDLNILVAPRLGMLDREHADGAFQPNDRHAGEAVEALLARFRAVGERRMIGGFGEVEDAPFRRDGADQALPHAQPGHVHCFLPQAMRREQLEEIVPEQVDRADVAPHRRGNHVDHAVELGLRRAALGHDLVQTGQDLAGGGGGGERHGGTAIRWRSAAPRTTFQAQHR